VAKFQSKDPETLSKAIELLNSELNKIKRDQEEEEEQRRQEEQRREEEQRKKEEQRREEEERKKEEQRKKENREELDLTNIPVGCESIKTIYNDYIKQKTGLNNKMNENKISMRAIQVSLDGTVKRLDGIRQVSLRGDAGSRNCSEFPEWYKKNALWFTKEFEQIKQMVLNYNSKNPENQVKIPLDNDKPYNFSGGKIKKTKKTKKTKKHKKTKKTKKTNRKTKKHVKKTKKTKKKLKNKLDAL